MSHLIAEHHGYLTDESRIGLYSRAIGGVVRAGDTVLDLGCGTGILGLMCLRAGAGHVTFIDNTDMIEVARETVRRAGYAGQATFICGWSHFVTVPKPADVVLCDNVGYFGIDYGILDAFSDAAHRFLRPGGRLLPQALRLCVAPVSGGRATRRRTEWSSEAVPEDFRWVGELAANHRDGEEIDEADLMSAGTELVRLELGVPAEKLVKLSGEAEVARQGHVEGLAGWFVAELAEGVQMTNAPDAPDRIRRPVSLFPLAEPLPVEAGDRLACSILARPEAEQWIWTVRNDRTGESRRQSTWLGLSHSASLRARQASGNRPTASACGRIRSAVIALCDGNLTAEEIEERVLATHAEALPSTDAVRAVIARALADGTE